MIIEETITKKIGKDTITNNLETNKITRNDEILLDYCILAKTGNTLTIRQGNMITQTGLEDNQYKEIIRELLREEPTKKEKTSKATIKGKKKQNKNTKKEEEEEDKKE